MDPQTTGDLLRNLLTAAWLLPLLGFIAEIYWLRWSHRLSKSSALCAVACIGLGFLCSFSALMVWGNATGWAALSPVEHHGSSEHHGSEASHPEHAPADAAAVIAGAGHENHGEEVVHSAKSVQKAFSGTFYQLAKFGSLKLSLDWYIDSLTLVMFTMVTFIATCIHIFAIGYMKDELTEEYEDHEVHTSHGHFTRPGRFHRFFAYLSLFCFSMLGLVLAGNIFQVFIFWELVGVCSYLLIGFYIERKSASTAANKAFIMNRVGDFGFLIGLMILWTWCGTFQFADSPTSGDAGLFTMVRGNDGKLDVSEDGKEVFLRDASGHRLQQHGQDRSIGYLLLIAAGCGIFAGCIGKSAQFPLQTWLPDAMEGPTPVSALVHSATMVAAGVYLAGRFYPMFTPEVLLVIAYIGCITLFIAATIAVVATDIKRVLAYSTISQLGYMMLAIGVGGWGAGLFHLVTHAFFKSLMFLCSGSVIAGCHHVQEMPRMGGLRRKMPITAYTMLVGVIAISGLAIPVLNIGLSGFYSKDAIVASALAYSNLNPVHSLLFFTPLVTAGITAFYMFRLWFLTFAGEPRDQHVYDHCHESPRVMTTPLIVLAVLAGACAWGWLMFDGDGNPGLLSPVAVDAEVAGEQAPESASWWKWLSNGGKEGPLCGGEAGPLFRLLADSAVVSADEPYTSLGPAKITIPSHHQIHEVHPQAGVMALIAAFAGSILAYVMYGVRAIRAEDIRRQFPGVHEFLVDKWRFDVLYDAMFVRPVHVVSAWCTGFDKHVLDVVLHTSAKVVQSVAQWDRKFDEGMVDGLVNLVGNVTRSVGMSLRVVQTGRLRQYVMWVAVGVVVLFAVLITATPR